MCEKITINDVLKNAFGAYYQICNHHQMSEAERAALLALFEQLAGINKETSKDEFINIMETKLGIK